MSDIDSVRKIECVGEAALEKLVKSLLVEEEKFEQTLLNQKGSVGEPWFCEGNKYKSHERETCLTI